MTLTERSTLKKFCDQGMLSSPRGRRKRIIIEGTNAGQRQPIPPVIRSLLINAAGFLLDLGPHLGY